MILKGACILVVEDDPFIAMDLTETLERAVPAETLVRVLEGLL